MQKIKISRALYNRFKNDAPDFRNGKNTLCLVSKNDGGILVRSDSIQNNMCSSRFLRNEVHISYMEACSISKSIPSCYFLLSYGAIKKMPILRDDIMFFHFDMATYKISLYNKDKDKFEAVKVDIVPNTNVLLINKELHKEIYDLKDKYFKIFPQQTYILPKVFMLAKNNSNVLVKMEELPTVYGNGCNEMLHVSNKYTSDIYTKLIKQGVTPCGYLSFTIESISSRSFHHFFESNELFINVGVYSKSIGMYSPYEYNIHPIEFKIVEV